MPPPEDSPPRSSSASERDRAEGVRAARATRHRRWADLQVEEAMRRGDFEGLRGAGRPLDLSDRHDPNWWVKRLIQREQIEAAAPPAIALRLENERLDDALDELTTEQEVRREVADFNRRVIDARRQLLGGPPVITPPRDVDAEVQRWRDRRDLRRAEGTARRDPTIAGSAHRAVRHRRAWPRRPRRARGRLDESGVARGLVVGGAAAVLLLVATILATTGRADPEPSRTAQPWAIEPTVDSSPPAETAPREASATSRRCSTANGRFRPTAVAIPDIGRLIEVVYPPRDANDIPGTPPLTTEGKSQMAYDTANGIAPGSPAGNALFNAHTWPDGSALGNALLRELRVGDRVEVRGHEGRTQCYRLVRRVQVPATVSGAQYYRRDGVPRMAIVVCSGARNASGAWSHRTLFFAKPVAGRRQVTSQ